MVNKDLHDVLKFYNYIGVCLVYLILLILIFIIGNFTRFHVALILKNNTTLEHLDSIRTKKPVTREYDLGTFNNWVSVFGKNKFFWFLPVTTVEMVSDGIIWMKSNKQYNQQTVTLENKN